MKTTTTSYIPKLQVSTRDYLFAHGKNPSGRGYWAFVFRSYDNKETVEFAPGSIVLYGEAKKWAIARGAELGSVRVSVGT